jgi:GNAT superfamily N-acetyltransferase
VATEIRRVRAGEGEQLRSIRLRALRDAPFAFASTLELEAGRSADSWERAAERRATSDTEATFVALDEDRWLGLAGAYVTENRPRAVELVSMWTAPECRRRGIGRRLVEAVADWAGSVGARTVELCVTEGNGPATRLYEGTGFVPTGECRPLASDPARIEVRIHRPVEGGPAGSP